MTADLRYQAFNSEVSFRNDFNKVFKNGFKYVVNNLFHIGMVE